MSGFKGTFTKEEGGEKNLDYDDSAFYYFAGVVLILIIIPTVYYFFKYQILHVETKESPIKTKIGTITHDCPCAICVQKRTVFKSPQKASRFGMVGFCHLLLILLLGYALYVTAVNISNSPKGIKAFDPYEILEIEVGATDKQIRSAFRELSKKYHPDKNPGNNWAAGKYITITKAYETLTNELAKANYEKYGNPDGPSPAKVAIGLPMFLLKTENHVSILVVFFAIIVIIVPGSLYLWITTSKKVDKNGVLQDNMPMYLKLINENMNIKQCLLMIAISAEFHEIPVPKSDSQELNKLRLKFLEFIPKKQNLNPKILKVLLLLLAHMNRKHLSDKFQQDLNTILTKAVNIIETMLDCAYIINSVPRAKKMSIHTFTLLIEVAQLITQGLWLHESNLLMLPHINDTNLKLISKSKTKGKITDIDINNLSKFEKSLSEQQISDIKEVLNYLPKLKVEYSVFVDGEEEIADGDVITVKVVITREQLQEDQFVGPIHAPRIPLSKYEKLWLLIAEPKFNKVLYMKSFFTNERVIEDKEFKVPLGPQGFNIGPGEHSWEIHVKSDSYYGLDVCEKLNFTVKKPEDAKREEYKVHPDDENIEKNATWLQSVMTGLQPEEESSEEENIPELEEIPEGKSEEVEDFELLEN